MRGSGNVVLQDGNRLRVDYTVNEQRRQVDTGSGTWLASMKSFAGSLKPIPDASPKAYILELLDGKYIRFYSDGTAVTFSGDLFSVES